MSEITEKQYELLQDRAKSLIEYHDRYKDHLTYDEQKDLLHEMEIIRDKIKEYETAKKRAHLKLIE